LQYSQDDMISFYGLLPVREIWNYQCEPASLQRAQLLR